MERLNWHMAEELSRHAEVRIVGPTGSAASAPAGIDVREVPLRPVWKFLLHAWLISRSEAHAWRPDIVLAGSGLTAPIVRGAAKLAGAKAVVYAHGLDVALQHPAYRAIWFPAIRRMDRVVANSSSTAQLCRDIGVSADRIGIIHPGVELPPPADAATDRSIAEFREREGLQARTLLLSVGRLSARKGMREFVGQALPRIVAARPDAILLIIGDAPTQALYAETQTPASIQAAADAAGVGRHIRFLGVITDFAELSVAYRAANVHVFPVRSISGDPEGFGMVAVEAAAHGLPTVAFATGGVLDAVSEGVSGQLIPPGDYKKLADTVCTLLGDGGVWAAGCTKFARGFAWEVFGTQLFEVLCHT